MLPNASNVLVKSCGDLFQVLGLLGGIVFTLARAQSDYIPLDLHCPGISARRWQLVYFENSYLLAWWSSPDA